MTITAPMRRRSFLALACAGAAAAPAWSQPAPMRMIVPYAPQGSADIFGRLVAGELGKALSEPVAVENQPGGGGVVGLRAIRQAAPDGRTLLLGQTGEIVVQPFFMRDGGARPAPVALVAIIPLVAVVSGTGPYAGFADLVEAMRTAPRGISAASPGRLTPGDLAIEVLRGKTGGRIASVPFPGGGPALNAVMEGQIDVYFSTLTSAMPYIRDGRLKALAVTSAARSPAIPDVPTMQESGIGRFAITQWAGVFAPAGTPDAVVGKLNAAINQALAQPETTTAITRDGGKIMPLSPGQFAGFIAADEKIYRDMLAAELCAEFTLETCSAGGTFVR